MIFLGKVLPNNTKLSHMENTHEMPAQPEEKDEVVEGLKELDELYKSDKEKELEQQVIDRAADKTEVMESFTVGNVQSSEVTAETIEQKLEEVDEKLDEAQEALRKEKAD